MVEGPFAANYEALGKLREMTATLKKNQEFRGVEGLKSRMAERAKRNTWRQMKGMQLAMHEINHPGNKPFLIGLGYVRPGPFSNRCALTPSNFNVPRTDLPPRSSCTPTCPTEIRQQLNKSRSTINDSSRNPSTKFRDEYRIASSRFLNTSLGN